MKSRSECTPPVIISSSSCICVVTGQNHSSTRPRCDSLQEWRAAVAEVELVLHVRGIDTGICKAWKEKMGPTGKFSRNPERN